MSEVRINYNAPLKSVRTQRVVKPQEPPKLSFDGSVDDGRTSEREEDVKRPGISFMWENAPGKSKIEEREESILPAELKLPPLSLTPTKAKDASPFYPPPAGTPAPKLNPFASLPPKLAPSPSRAAAAAAAAATDRTPPRSLPIPAPPARRSSTPTRQPRSGEGSGGRQAPTSGTSTGAAAGADKPQDRRGGHHQRAERLPQAPSAQKDFFYAPTRNAPVQQQPQAKNGRLPPSSPRGRDNFETGSHSSGDWDGNAGDVYSLMDHYQAQCQVSMLDGCVESELHDKSRHTDPRARDFIMQRFLPAAKAMVADSADSGTGSPSGSPRMGRSATAAGRSRFATFKDQFDAEGAADDGDEDDDEEQNMLFKCKFPWQVSPFGSLCLPAPAPQPGGLPRGRGSEKPDDEKDYADAHEGRGPPANFRTRSGSSTNTDGGMARDHDQSQTFSVDLQQQVADSYEGEGSMRSNDSRRAYGAGTRDRLQDTPPHGDSTPPRTPPLRRKPEPEFSGNLGTLLRTSNQTGKGMAKLVPATAPDAPDAEARRLQALADSSILNHHRYKSRQPQPQHLTTSDSMPDLRSRDVSPFQSRLGASLGGSASSFTPAHPSDDAGPPYGRHLRQSLYKQDTAGDSGRFMESISDEAWEAIDAEPTPAHKPKPWRDELYEQQQQQRGMAATSESSDPADDARAIGWPLGKAYSAFSKILSSESKSDSPFARTPSSDSKHDSSYSRTPSTDSKTGSSYMRTASSESKAESAYTRTSSNDTKYDSSFLRTPSSDSKGDYFQSYSDLSASAFPQQKEPSSADKFSPVSVLLQPPLPKGPRESWLGKLMAPAPAPLSNMSNWQQAGPKKFLEHSISEDSMDVKWEALVKSKNAHARNLKLQQDVQNRDRD
ncbi:hypothetical protein MPTK1_7g08290 [Marchantia polymorpha subsp. ruderalis]|uniref:Uncharacterized protein n=2 Tax=Marchantia polymorpha TaxID=3197 RepID=A0AAF6BXC8_MARPO|nr:hypothetical protein MARPO_0146s0029 [Marchantia polymorpha]BBN16662.1 hypothetical protein Mp_7g08290 [Marchantia polymorpha subsp. ruderalis]|eukprot:PTQ29211.1 hypothetical protein MARPO_0146s0029 [Marchantia polymorpha]